jgi:2-amino-4-hydroxy-6-hydroxymethyldihydropteridine diphosphokinase
MIILGFGSNIGERREYMQAAVRCLQESGVEIVAVSTVYESPALLKPDAPEEWQQPFLNMAVRVATDLSPQDLLKQIKMIEQKIGRKDRGVWAPREIDIDILAYGNLYIDEDNLKIPHVALCSRAFAILPFAEIAPDWRYPVQGKFFDKTACEIASALER